MSDSATGGTEYLRLQQLRRAYAAFRDSFINGAMLDELGQKIQGYLGFQQHQLVGGYSWFCGMYFRAGNGVLSVMLPWMEISQGKKSPERAVEVRVFGEVSSGGVEVIIERLAGLLRGQMQINDSRYQ